MRLPTILASALAFAAFSVPSLAPAQPNPTVVDALDAIRSQADDVAAGRAHGKIALRKAADAIAVQWQKAEPIVAANPNVIVETKIANAAIRQYESRWKNPELAKSDAKDVSTAVASLRTDLTPPPSAAPTAPANAEPANDGTPVPATSGAPSTAPSR